MSDTNESEEKSRERFAAFMRFIIRYVGAFSAIAKEGFDSRGPGAVLLMANELEGGDQFRPQELLALHYASEADLSQMEWLDKAAIGCLLRQCDFTHEAVIVAQYDAGYHDMARVDFAQIPKGPPPLPIASGELLN
jgi:hypothetical protein